MQDEDLGHLRRCVELAARAVDRGDDPFGSVLVGGDGSVLAEEENRVNSTGDVTAHPELALASWASRNMTVSERAAATMFTSGEHCPMCAAAHVWAGIGRLVFVLSGHQIRSLTSGGVRFDLSSRQVIESADAPVVVEGPCPDLEEAVAKFFVSP